MAYNGRMVFIETSIFTKDIKKYLSDEEYRRLQESLMLQPTVGELIQGSGGLRKVRWSVSNEGKSGGIRIIYYWHCPDTLYMLFVYKKNVQEDLTPSQLAILRRLVKEWLQ